MKPSVACTAIACSLLCAAAGTATIALPAEARPRHQAQRPNPGPRADPRDLSHCPLRGAHPTDNDIRLNGTSRSEARPIPVPGPVARTILEGASRVARSRFTVQEWREARVRCRDIFGPVQQIAGPGGLELYVAPREFPTSGGVDQLVMYDPRSRGVTQSPPLIYTKWSMGTGESDPLVKAPVVRMEAGKAGRPPLLIVEERTHNGNMYDAAVYRYFEIGADMALTQVLAVEARAILLSNRDEYTERTATFLTPDRVRLEVTSRSRRHIGATGSVLLERATPGAAFHVGRRMPAEGQSGQGLVTYCDSAKSDDDFLRVGCDFYY
jgi:hypothetical protein